MTLDQEGAPDYAPYLRSLLVCSGCLLRTSSPPCVPSGHPTVGRLKLLWLEMGKEKWESLQAAKQQAIITSQVRRHPSWLNRQYWELSVGPAKQESFLLRRPAASRLIGIGAASWMGRGMEGEWSEAPACGAPSSHLSLMSARDSGDKG